MSDARDPRAGVLDRILATKRAEIAAMRAAPPKAPWKAPKPGLFEALKRPEIEPRAPLRLITEIKLRSPSAGDLSRALAPHERALVYARGGATMISVLTDQAFFAGSFEHLSSCRDALDASLGDARPYLLCKEFILDAIQLDAALAAGADAVLLIVRCLDDANLAALVRASESRGLVPLVEVTTEVELGRAINAGARVIGVNARDLDTLVMDAARAARVLGAIDGARVAVHLSGLRGPEDVKSVASGRADAALMGEALMRRDDPAPLLAEMRRAAG